MKCTLDIPYPPVEVTAENAQYAKLLSRDYAGIASELTANRRMFIRSRRTGFRKSFQALWSASQVKNAHMTFWATCIFLLRGDPRLGECARNRFIYWDGTIRISQNRPPSSARI